MIALDKFEAVIFDMDGVLIDSEPLWKIAMEAVFKEVGCPLTRKDFQKTVGLRLDEVIAYWFSVVPWKEFTVQQVEEKIVLRMVDLIRENGVPLPGVVETIAYLKAKNLKIGLGTSSYEILIKTVLSELNIADEFDFVHSAENEQYGKPHPAVYLTVAKNLGVAPVQCLVIEDSLTGIISGKAARMTVVAIPEKTHDVNPKLILADYEFENMHLFLDAVRS
ncbi:MAG: hexitol phosphatase HxpB [Crocinitomicaceae bacterium]